MRSFMLPSQREVKWWFKSRETGRLNMLSYLIFLFLCAFIAAVILSALWQALNEKQSQLHRTSGVFNWVYGSPIETLRRFEETFVKQRRQFYSFHEQPGEERLLVNARQLVNKDTSAPTARMFAIPAIKVYPTFVTYSAPGDSLTQQERRMFAAFASFVTEKFAKYDSNHFERTLANYFGISRDQSKSSSADSISFNVPWLYVANKRGAIAVYPGSTVIGEEKWNTTSRPWYEASFSGQRTLTDEGFAGDDFSYTYLDVLARSPMLVRTYMHRLPDTFLVCIDMHLRGDEGESQGLVTSIANLDRSFEELFITYLDPVPLRRSHYTAFIVSFLILWLLRKYTAVNITKYSFSRKSGEHGIINASSSINYQSEESATSRVGFEWAMPGRFIRIRGEESEIDIQQFLTRRGAELIRSHLRGYEIWIVTEHRVSRWPLFWIRFESSSATLIGTIVVWYTNQVLPRAEWAKVSDKSFAHQEIVQLRERLLPILVENVDQFPGGFDITSPIDEVQPNIRKPLIPDWVRAVVDAKELLAPRQCRAYVKLSSEQIKELYSKSDVKAVMTAGYLEQLLNSGQIDLLLKGRTVSRVISFRSPQSSLNLDERGGVTLRALLERYARASSRSLMRVNTEIKENTPVYDFAILNDSAVIVAHFISKAVGIDTASGKPTQTTHHIEGYISWRSADISFYYQLFEELVAKSVLFEPAGDGNNDRVS